MNTTLVTGAGGFIGSYVVSELLSRGIAVIATDREREKASQRSWFNEVEFIEADIANLPDEVLQRFARAGRLIHLAWQGLPNYKELFHYENNLLKQYFFLKKLVESGIRDIAVSGTCFEYGMREGALSTDMEPNPHNPYALAKDTLRRFLQELQKKQPFQLKWMRLFYTYGKGQMGSSLLSQLEKAIADKSPVFNLSGGEQLRDYLPVEEMAARIVDYSLDDKLDGIVNCCSGKPISIKRLVEDYVKENNYQIKLNFGYYPYNDYEPMAFWGVIKK